MANRFTSCALVIIFLTCFWLPVVDADGIEQAPTYAFLESWDGRIGDSLDPSGESFANGLEFSNHDFDNVGNMYYIESEDSVNWLDGQYSVYQRGFHILKVDSGGALEYSEVIACSQYCNYPDYTYTKAIGMHVVDEDKFYVVLSVYRSQLTFGGQSYPYDSGYSLYTAFFNNGSWSWVDKVSTSGNAYSKVVFMSADDSKNFFMVTTSGASGSWTDYSITSYSPNGTNWVRTLDLPYQSPTYNSFAPLFDVEASEIHAFLTVPNQLKYDSQTVNCGLSGEGGVCHIWLTIGQNGAKTSAVASPYSSIKFNRMTFHNSSLYLSGNTDDPVVGSDTESNFTGQKITHSPRYAQYVAVMENNGSWAYHLAVNQFQSYSLYNYGYLTDVLDDGTLIFNGIFTDNISIDGSVVTAYPSSDGELVLLAISPESGLIWSRSIGFNNPNSYPLSMLSDGDTVAFHVDYPSNGEVFYESSTNIQNGNPGGTGNNGSGNYIFWVDTSDGKIVDIESTSAIQISGRSDDGGVIASGYQRMYYFMPDFDGDNVGTGDNCPDNYNPNQLDYNDNGLGDVCDDDDDSDSVKDISDSCPRGVKGWTSTEVTDYDDDGCKDLDEEDLDDDEDGIPDTTDACPVGIIGAGFDLDGDGCKDVEDPDDDGDLVRDESDLCPSGVVGWSSGTLTDHDSDGCQDIDPEDKDDDNDGIADTIDSCPKGATNWPSNINTDFDGDGCKDGFEDEDDDNDGISNVIDDCPRSFGAVNTQGCSATQSLDNDGGESAVYYVCPAGSIVVLDPSDCPEDTSSDDNTEDLDEEDDDTFYYVCPGGTDVVTDLSECEGSIVEGGTNITLVIDPSSNNSNDYITCDGGVAIVLDKANCPEEIKQESTSSVEENSDNGLMVLFMGGTFAMSAIAMVVVLVRRPTRVDSNFQTIDSTDRLFKDEKEIPQAINPPSPPPSSTSDVASKNSHPSADMIGRSYEGKEWLEWPQGSDNHYYRELGFGGEWTRYE